MTKSIEQIAMEVAHEVIGADGIDEENKTVGPFLNYELAEFLRRCLAKIGEGLEPVAYSYEWYGHMNEYSESQEWNDGYDRMHPSDYALYDASTTRNIKPLYATPHEAIIAAEQRVAAACAKFLDVRARGDDDCGGDFYEGWIAGQARASEAIRSGEWRRYV